MTKKMAEKNTENYGVFRRTLRIPASSQDDLDRLVINKLLSLEEISPFRMQEWIRSALRLAITQESLALSGKNTQEIQALLEILQKSVRV